MRYLVRERRARARDAAGRVALRRHRKWCGLIPDADLATLSDASVAHRLAEFGIDADAEPLLEKRKTRGP